MLANEPILMTLIFVHEIYVVIGFFVFLVFQWLKIKVFSEQVRPVGFSSESLQAAFFNAVTVGVEFFGSE